MIISFGWTSQYLPPQGTKDTTRRIWTDRTFKSWVKAWENRKLTHTAVNKQLCFGGKRIGTITLTDCPYLERVGDMPQSDLIREGGMVGTVDEFIAKYFEGNPEQIVAVIRFKFSPEIQQKLIQLNLLKV